MWRRLLTVPGVIGLLVAVVGLIAHFRTPRSTTTLAISAISPYLVIGSIGALVCFAIARGVVGWVGLGSAVVLICCYALIQGPLYRASAVPAGGHDVVIMTANLRLGRADPAAILAAVRSRHVDLLMLEELTPDEVAGLVSAGLDRELPHSVVEPRNNAGGTGLWSRYPLSAADTHHDFSFAFITARVAVPGAARRPTVVALHMAGPYPMPHFWTRDIAHLPSVLHSIPADAPVLVGGDFNATTDMTQFRRLLHGGYADAVDQAGAGYLPTFPNNRIYPPVIAIDHVLTRDATAMQACTLSLAGSDHRALLATVRLPD